MPVLSIITINYNNKAGLERTINSVISQTNKSFEFIVIDGGSGDGSVDVIEKYEEDISYSVSEKDKGIYHAQNKGILRASGRYCLFLNSGDLLADNRTIECFSAHLKDTGIIYGDLITIDKEGKKEELLSPEDPDVPYFMVSTLWHPCAFIQRELFTQFGLYNEEFKITGDYEFFIRAILKNNVSTKHISLPVSIFDLSGISNSEASNELQLSERKKSWQLNFNDATIENFEKQTRYSRTRIGKLTNKFFNPYRK